MSAGSDSTSLEPALCRYLHRVRVGWARRIRKTKVVYRVDNVAIATVATVTIEDVVEDDVAVQ